MNKATHRVQMLAVRQSIPADYAASAAQKIAQKLQEMIAPNTVVAGYVSMRSEIDVMPALKILSANYHPITLPVITQPERILSFLAWSENIPLIEGAYGTLCPNPDSKPLVPDVVLVPLLGFDSEGYRLGYGGGYYDATIASLRAANKQVRIIGVAYSLQKIENLPHEAHDALLDAVVTEQEVLTWS